MKKIILYLFISLLSINSWAYDFTESGFYYNITCNTMPGWAVEVTSSSPLANDYQGKVVLPLTYVVHNEYYRITSIGRNAFSGCNCTSVIALNNDLNKLSSKAFADCPLSSVSLGKNCYSLGDSVFFNCTNLKYIHLRRDPYVGMGKDIFKGVDMSNCKLCVPVGTASQYYSTAQWDLFANIVEETYSQEELDILKNIDATVDKSNNLNWDAVTQANANLLTGITWDNSTPKRIASINISNKGLQGIISFSGIDSLSSINCSNNQIERVDVSNNPKLQTYYCNNNNIRLISIDKNLLLSDFDCSSNVVVFTDFSKNALLSKMNCSNNNISFWALSTIPTSVNSSSFVYSPQKNRNDDGSYLVGDDIDYSDDAVTCNGKSTLFSFYRASDSTLVDSTRTGIYTSKIAGTFFCKETNASFPNLTYRWNGIGVIHEYYQPDLDSLLKIASRIDSNKVLDWNTASQSTASSLMGINWTDKIPKRVNEIRVSDKKLKGAFNLSGLDSLRSLNCNYSSNITSIDVSKNPCLTSLVCVNNQITSIDVSKNLGLEELSCSNNLITSLNLGNINQLRYLDCADNRITSLDVSKNSLLGYLDCRTNKQTSLDVSKNSQLQTLNCSCNSLQNIDITKDTLLKTFRCLGNKITNLDITKNHLLTEIDFGSNQITNIDLTKNINLTKIICGNNLLTSLDVSKNTALTWLSCTQNKLASLDLSCNPLVFQLDCASNNITSLNLTKAVGLQFLYCCGNLLSNLDVSKNTNLYILRCSDNKLTSIDVSKDTLLEDLTCYSNQISSLNLSKNPKLTTLDCSSNNLDSLNISMNPLISMFRCSSNNLKTLDLSKNTNLYSLGCDRNFLTFKSLNIEKIPFGYFLSYSPQRDIRNKNVYNVGDTINYSSEKTIRDTNTTLFKFYDESNNLLESNSTGKHKCTGKEAYCIMSHASFPNLTINYLNSGYKSYFSSDLAVLKNIDASSDKNNNLNWNVAATQDSAYYTTGVMWSLTLPHRVLKISGSFSGLTGNVSFTGLDSLKCIDFSFNQISNLDISKNPQLTTLRIRENNLSSLDASNNPNLTDCDCSFNYLTFKYLKTVCVPVSNAKPKSINLLVAKKYFTYYPQKDTTETATFNSAIDYSKDTVTFKGNTTFFKLYRTSDSTFIDSTRTGKFKSVTVGKYYLTEQHNSFPNLIFKYKGINVSTTAINENYSESLNCFVYPNPTTMGFFISSDNLPEEVLIYDNLGKIVLSQKLISNYVDISSLGSGIYLVKLKNKVIKIIKK